ncbi:hypothetical protein CO174_00235 [Candidatus Uhrbacteria bacterium CG_4_9_14_3_um_filter_50_9]|uniref:Uncharacterized protein n=1 Tax=Candidatus Uhrbacteria bacterium CG_4_9_14_3_um_filter_50_9 TaxID=1975035 RepID=A0A2M7XEZ2_9BACT|nr:MAG: hypothetical protein CO174_00235 [Candidatus Uhrbacteria bacterium CG_4_9_14_3_um_filter_50_9]
MLKLHLPNRQEIVDVVLQEGDIVGLENPRQHVWLLTLHGSRRETITHFLFEGGDDKMLLRSRTHAQAVVEIEGIIGPEFRLGEPRINPNGPWYYPIIRR